MLYAIDPPLFECHLKYANSGLTYMKDAVSGGKNCTTGNNHEHYQHFFILVCSIWTEFNQAFFVCIDDKDITIAANENGTEWKPTTKNETDDNQEGSGITEEGNK